METMKPASMEARRDRTGGIVRDRLDVLMAEMRREDVPPRLLDLAEELQAAIDEKIKDAPSGS